MKNYKSFKMGANKKFPEKSEERKQRYSLNQIMLLAQNENSFLVGMIELFIKTVKDGMIEMNDGVTNNLWDVVAYQAHKIASPCVHFEAEEIYNLLKQIEDKARENDTADLKPLFHKLESETRELLISLEADVIHYKNSY